MRYYFASRYSSHPLMKEYRDRLIAEIPSSVVTSRWIDQHGGDQLNSFVLSELNKDPNGCWKYGNVDIEDIETSDTIVSFTFEDGGGKGGRHVEFGYGLAVGKQMMIVGPRENIFHCHPEVFHYWTFEEFLEDQK